MNGNGRNGKSKTIELMKNFLGHKNCTGIPIQKLEKDKFSIIGLFGKMANLAGDISKEALGNTGVFKNLTGRDPIDASRKFQNSITFVNYAKMIFACNELPETNDMTDGFWERWVYLDFPYKFVSQKDYDKALVQETALYKRNLEDLSRIVELGDVAFNNKDYETVKNSFNYILENTQNPNLILDANLYLLETAILTASSNVELKKVDEKRATVEKSDKKITGMEDNLNPEIIPFLKAGAIISSTSCARAAIYKSTSHSLVISSF
jgi:hypothetical protein